MHVTSTLSSTVQYCYFFFNDTATTEIYTLSLHDALPISRGSPAWPRRSGPLSAPAREFVQREFRIAVRKWTTARRLRRDRKSTRLNSSHQIISYAVFCLKKKKRVRNSSSIRVSDDSVSVI